MTYYEGRKLRGETLDGMSASTERYATPRLAAEAALRQWGGSHATADGETWDVDRWAIVEVHTHEETGPSGRDVTMCIILAIMGHDVGMMREPRDILSTAEAETAAVRAHAAEVARLDLQRARADLRAEQIRSAQQKREATGGES